jgi:hypothetical protein
VNDSEERLLRRALADLVSGAPPAPAPVGALLHRGGRALRLRRGVAAGVAALAVVLAAAAIPVLWDSQQGNHMTPPAGSHAPTTPALEVPDLPPRTVTDEMHPQTGPRHPVLGRWYAYDLFTHCGIGYASFGGVTWHAVPEQPEPSSTPGPSGGTGHPLYYLAGYMRQVSPGRAEFVSIQPKVRAELIRFPGEAPLCS